MSSPKLATASDFLRLCSSLDSFYKKKAAADPRPQSSTSTSACKVNVADHGVNTTAVATSSDTLKTRAPACSRAPSAEGWSDSAASASCWDDQTELLSSVDSPGSVAFAYDDRQSDLSRPLSPIPIQGHAATNSATQSSQTLNPSTLESESNFVFTTTWDDDESPTARPSTIESRPDHAVSPPRSPRSLVGLNATSAPPVQQSHDEVKTTCAVTIDARGSKWARIGGDRSVVRREAATCARPPGDIKMCFNNVIPDRPGSTDPSRLTSKGVDLTTGAAPEFLAEKKLALAKLEIPGAPETPATEMTRGACNTCQRQSGDHKRENIEKLRYDREFLMRFECYRTAPDGFMDIIAATQGESDMRMTTITSKEQPNGPPNEPALALELRQRLHLNARGLDQSRRQSLGDSTGTVSASAANPRSQWTSGTASGGIAGRCFSFNKVREPIGPPIAPPSAAQSRGFQSRARV